MFGNPETTTGGRALKFYSSIRLDIRRIESIKQSGEIVANRTRVKVVKNKVAPPFKQCEFDITFGKGIDSLSEIVDLSVEHGLLSKNGAWYTINDEKCSGKEAIKEYLKIHTEALNELVDGLTKVSEKTA